jgi:trans-aconitate 2-methyltransferase
MARDGWNPQDYGTFRDDRRRPFFDLLRLLKPVTAPRVLDVGCGTGELTAEAHALLSARSTIGLDASPAMLAKAVPTAGVELLRGACPEQLPAGAFDVILSNSALNWVPDHHAVLEAFSDRLAPGGQLGLQMPSNTHSPFSACAEEVARKFSAELSGYVYRSPVERPEVYSQWLEELGFTEQHVGAWLYPQRHPEAQAVADFARGGLLSPYRERLEPEAFARYEAEYRKALRKAWGPGPVFFPFRRVFVWGRLGPKA